MSARNTTFSIIKALAIILMVIGHAEAPGLITNFIYTFHMPVFFIAAGYFFQRKYLQQPWEFCAKRFRGLYVPMVKWSIMFLLLHNVFFYFGILNEQYGNWTGGVTHPYSWHSALQRLVLIVTSMSGYDEFMAGAFWFFRGLLVASIVFMVLYKLLDERTRLTPVQSVSLIALATLGFAALFIANKLKLSFIPNGGMREIWGVLFFAVGVLFQRVEHRLPRSLWIALGCAALLTGAAMLHLHGMNNRGELLDVLTLPLTGCVGFVMLYILAAKLDRWCAPRVHRLLTYIGDNTVAVFVFHIIAFKVVSLLKIWYYGLDFGQIGCHMVIHYNHTDFFWVLYSVVGVALPLLWLTAYRRLRQNKFFFVKRFCSHKKK